MTLARSLVYVVWLYGSMGVIGLCGLPWAMASRRGARDVIRTWAGAALFGLRWICGVRLEVRGREHIPSGAALVAGKHQAMLDTIAPFLVLDDPAMVLKRELLKLPIYSHYALRGGHIPVDREAHAAALKGMLRAARVAKADGRQIVIFPEGTRTAPGAAADYKPGVAALYRDLGVPCTPVALNTGLFWPAHGVKRTPGTAVIEFLPAIPAGLSREAFMSTLESRIETASARLLEEGRAK